MRALYLLALAAMPLLPAADPVFARAWDKLERIENGQVRPGATVLLTPAEMNAWAKGRVPQMYEGVRDPRIALGRGTATGSALIDFVKLRQGEGVETNRMLAKLLEGERLVKVSVRLTSGDGQATAYLTNVEIGGVNISGPVLDFLVKDFLLPLFPNASVNQPFDLGDNIDRIDLNPDGVRVTMRK